MQNNKEKTYMICGSLAIIAIAAAIVIAYLFNPANVYARQISSAEKQLEHGDYSAAILSYRNAIEEDPDSVEAYAGLADIYLAQNDTASAIDILRIGAARTDSARLRLLLNTLISEEGSVTAVNHIDLNTDEAVYFDTSTVHMIGTYSYADYSSRYGLEHKEGNRDGSILCTFKGIAAEFTFGNTSGQPNAVSATIVASRAVPVSVVYRNVLNIFGVSDFISYETLQTLHLTDLHIMDHPSMGKAVQFEEANVRITIQSDENGNISAGADNTFVPLKSEQPQIDEVNTIHARGTVKDSETDTPVEGVYLAVREGPYQTGAVLSEMQTDILGNYDFSLNPGEYTIEVSASGYVSQFVTIYISSYETTHIQDIVLNRDGILGQARIVLTWGASPANLDAFLVGRQDNGTLVLANFIQMRTGNIAYLDMDVSSGYGPETIVLNDLNGMYYFWVSSRTDARTTEWINPTVTVYLPGQPAVTIEMNSNIDDYFWDVFELDHGQLRIINQGYTWDLSSYNN